MSAKTLDQLPLFASDDEIAQAVVGPKRAKAWIKDHLPALEKLPGFPPCEVSHGGRYTPAVKAFYDRRYNLDRAGVPGIDGDEDLQSWRDRRGRQRLKPRG